MTPAGRLVATILLAFSTELWPRRARAAVLELAARVELATSPADTWKGSFVHASHRRKADL